MTTADARFPAITPVRRLVSVLAAGTLPVLPAQIVVWLLAAAIALIVRTPLALALSLLVIALTSVRVAGGHFTGWAWTWVRFRLRQHEDRRLTGDPLFVLAPDFRLRQHHDRAGGSFGVAGVGDGWTAVLRISPGLSPRGEPRLSVLAPVLREACDNAEIPLAGAQLTVRTEGDERVHLLAVRYRPAEAPLAAMSRGVGELGEHRATVRAALGVLGALTGIGWRGRILEAGELAAELRETLGVRGDVLAAGRRTGAVVEGWRSWSAGGTTQTCFTLRGDLESAFSVSARGAAFTVVSYTLRRTAIGRLRDDVLVRLVKHQGMRKPPRPTDLDLPVVPLYGRHETAVRRTLPLGLAH